MFKRFSIPFLLCMALLVLSEYIFLQEITGARRPLVVGLTVCGLSFSLFFFSYLYKAYRKSAK